jgi:hypothetical protein
MIEIIKKPILITIYKSGINISGDALWEVDGSDHIKPKFYKKINTIHLDGEIFGGIFQP